MPTDRPANLQALIDAAEIAFTARAGAGSADSVAGCFTALRECGETTHGEGSRLPVCEAHLASAADPDCFGGADLARLAKAFLSVEPNLVWRKRSGTNPQAHGRFEDGHANAMIAGPGGLERRRDLWLGVTLLAPHVRYPDHTHPPEETYLVMSAGEFSQGGGPWFEPGPGVSFYNPPGILHAMRSGSGPLFAFWLLRVEEPAA